MQVSGYTSSLPLSTQIIQKAGSAAQAPDSTVTPEQVNRAVDNVSDRVDQAQASRETNQTDRRTYATQLYSASSQQQQVDIYLAVASEGKVDSDTGSKPTALQLSDDAAADVSDKPTEPGRERPPVTEQPVQPEQYLSIDTSA